jgi:23S rRNA (guanine745-N1)-methyltransferase
MLTARRRFLEAGHYRRLQQTIATVASRHLRARSPDGNQSVVVDVGCGEGGQLAGIGDAIKPVLPAVRLVGLDVSKDAARMTARRDRAWDVAVADVRRGLPLRDGSVQVLLNSFAPRNAAAFSRALTSNGIAIVVIPSDEHLVELRDAVGLLRVEPMKLERLVHQSAGHLALWDILSVDESCTFDVMAIEDILMMTPNAWHLTDAQRRRAAALTPMTVTVSFRVVVFRQAGYQQQEHWLRTPRAVGQQPRMTFLARGMGSYVR